MSTVLNTWKNGAPSRGGAQEMTVSSCMCEPMETARSLGDDTHEYVTRLKGHQSTDCTVCGPWRRWVESLAHPMRARTRTRGNVNVRPRPLVKTNRHKTARREEETRIQELTPAPHNTQYTAQPITTTHLPEATTNKETLCFCVRSVLLFTVGTEH